MFLSDLDQSPSYRSEAASSYAYTLLPEQPMCRDAMVRRSTVGGRPAGGDKMIA
jgi:hypothetical protein